MEVIASQRGRERNREGLESGLIQKRETGRDRMENACLLESSDVLCCYEAAVKR